MKTILFTILLLTGLAGTGLIHAQRPARRNPQIRELMLKKVREAKWAYIVYTLNLDEKRANQLLPVYRAYEAEKRVIFSNAMKQLPDDEETLTDEQAGQLMNAKLESAQKILDLKEKYKAEFLKILTPSELLHLQRAEIEFAVKIQAERQKRRNTR